jgi:hypothetical protein
MTLEYLNPVFIQLWAAALIVITALAHSVLGEQRLIGPLLAKADGVLESPLARNVTRFAWHWTSALWLLAAAVLALSAYGDIQLPWLVFAIGAAHFVFGVADAILTKGRHVGWPLITLAGALALLAFYLTQTA